MAASRQQTGGDVVSTGPALGLVATGGGGATDGAGLAAGVVVALVPVGDGEDGTVDVDESLGLGLALGLGGGDGGADDFPGFGEADLHGGGAADRDAVPAGP